MSKYLLLLLIWIGKPSEGKSQSSDTLCFPVPVIQKLLVAGKQKKELDSLITVYMSDINFLSLDVRDLKEKQKNSEAIAAAYQGQVNVLTKDLKKQKRKTKWAAFGGLALSGIITALFVFK